MYGSSPTHMQSPNTYAVALQKQLTLAYDTVRYIFKTQHQRQKELYDKNIHGNPYIVGDWVWLLNPKVPKNNTKKLFHPWQGPYKIIKKIAECTYRIQALKGGRRQKVAHFNQLKPCPKNIWLTEDLLSTDNADMDNHSYNDTSLGHTTSQPPVGTQLKLVDDDDYEQLQELPDTPSSQLNTTNDISSSSSRWYPLRQRWAPIRLNDYVLFSI